jgi:hypothetical protein
MVTRDLELWLFREGYDMGFVWIGASLYKQLPCQPQISAKYLGKILALAKLLFCNTQGGAMDRYHGRDSGSAERENVVLLYGCHWMYYMLTESLN